MLFSEHANKLVISQNVESQGSLDETAKNTHLTIQGLIKFATLTFWPSF